MKFIEKRLIVSNNLSGEISLSRLTAIDAVSAVGLAIVFTMNFIIKPGVSGWFLPFFWMIALGETIKYFMFRKVRPSTIILSGDKILRNDESPMTKDIHELDRIKFSYSGDIIKLCFSDKSKIKLSEHKYPFSEIKRLLNRIREIRGSGLTIDEELLRRLNSR